MIRFFAHDHQNYDSSLHDVRSDSESIFVSDDSNGLLSYDQGTAVAALTGDIAADITGSGLDASGDRVRYFAGNADGGGLAGFDAAGFVGSSGHVGTDDTDARTVGETLGVAGLDGGIAAHDATAGGGAVRGPIGAAEALVGSSATGETSSVAAVDGAIARGLDAASRRVAQEDATGTRADSAAHDGAASADAASGAPAAAPISPPPAFLNAQLSTDTGIPGDGITSDNMPTLIGTTDAGSSVTLTVDAHTMGRATAAVDGTWSIRIDRLADGPHEVTVTATDGATTTSTAMTITIDTGAPVAPTMTLVPGNGSSPSFLAGSAEPGAVVTVVDESGTVVGMADVSASGAWSLALVSLGVGDRQFTATARDAAGNASASTSLSATLTGGGSDGGTDGGDTAAPERPAIAAIADDTGRSDSDRITADATPTLVGTAEAGARVTVRDAAGHVVGTAQADASGAWSLGFAGLGEGAHAFTATATDAAGNVGPASATMSLVIDTVAPDAPTIASHEARTEFVLDTPVVLDGTAEAGSIVSVADASGEIVGTVVAGEDGEWSLELGQLSAGSYSFTATATDAAGNTSDAAGATVEVLGPGKGLHISGSATADALKGGVGEDVLRGMAGDDHLTGGGGADRMYGGVGRDRLLGGAGDDSLDGGLGGDRIDGGAGDDRIALKAAAAAYADIALGGAGADYFEMAKVATASVAVTAKILDFRAAAGDVLDLSRIDADVTTAGDQAFHYVGVSKFSGIAGEARAYATERGYTLATDIDGDAHADVAISLAGVRHLHLDAIEF